MTTDFVTAAHDTKNLMDETAQALKEIAARHEYCHGQTPLAENLRILARHLEAQAIQFFDAYREDFKQQIDRTWETSDLLLKGSLAGLGMANPEILPTLETLFKIIPTKSRVED